MSFFFLLKAFFLREKGRPSAKRKCTLGLTRDAPISRGCESPVTYNARPSPLI